MKRVLLLLSLLALASGLASASVISLLTSRAGATDSLNWGTLYAVYVNVASGTVADTAGGNQVTVSFSGGQEGQIRQQSYGGWNGDFTPKDILLWNAGHGPDTLAFANPISAIVFQIQTEYMGAYTSQISAYHGLTPLASFQVIGNSTANADGTAAYLGVQDTTAEITSVVIDGIAASASPEDFAINQLSLRGGSAAVPEPVTWLLLGAGLIAAGALRRKRS